jgi:hypothetical protein
MTEDKGPLKDQVRVIRWRMAHEKTRFFDGFWIIPRWLKGLTVALFIVGQVVAPIAHLRWRRGRHRTVHRLLSAVFRLYQP